MEACYAVEVSPRLGSRGSRLVRVRASPDSVGGHGGRRRRREFRAWSSVCVANVELKSDVEAQYRYGGEGEWKAVKIEKNTMIVFSQRFPTDVDPLKFEVKFLSKTDGPELSYALDQTETRLRPRDCGHVENYEFKGPTPAPARSTSCTSSNRSAANIRKARAFARAFCVLKNAQSICGNRSRMARPARKLLAVFRRQLRYLQRQLLLHVPAGGAEELEALLGALDVELPPVVVGLAALHQLRFSKHADHARDRGQADADVLGELGVGARPAAEASEQAHLSEREIRSREVRHSRRIKRIVGGIVSKSRLASSRSEMVSSFFCGRAIELVNQVK